uniref:GDSL esterase/lipase At5g45910-like n=1 Tax=Nicotiana sylvestris TaxID=4096 RepID=A0A1U7Y0T1_NICSY|nr:PREDICTED: GDSL esterase/lipase At5g45910-like [Nicotiana sylvestris]
MIVVSSLSMASLTNHCFFLILLLIIFSASSAKAQEQSFPFYSIYSFGDSNSASTSDHLAAVLGLPSLQHYTNEGVEFESGISFMTPGATVMSPFSFIKNGIPAPQQSHHSQISAFMKLFYKDCFSFHDCGRNKVLQKAIIYMDQPGFNDYKHSLLHTKSISEVSKLVPDVVETIKSSIEQLIKDAEAKHFVVTGIIPMGCLPGFREDDNSRKIKCHKGLNLFATLHNDHLWQALEELRLKYPEVEIIYADYYKAFMAVLRNHAFLGFKTETLMKVCCGSTGSGPFNFDPLRQCGEKGAVACSDRASHIHWDGFRLTPEASKNMIDTFFSKKGFVFPEFKFATNHHTAAAERHRSKVYGRFRDGLRHLLELHANNIVDY